LRRRSTPPDRPDVDCRLRWHYGAKLTAAARKAGQKANARIAAERAADIAPIIAELQDAGARSLQAIAVGLNERGIPTARGTGTGSATQVMRVLART
jgi:hypothetical protein